ncbi:MAG: hypothetical protein LBS83_00755 [Holosporales bacterium]|nr:hypothetical protein [Holosporales bacterium]
MQIITTLYKYIIILIPYIFQVKNGIYISSYGLRLSESLFLSLNILRMEVAFFNALKKILPTKYQYSIRLPLKTISSSKVEGAYEAQNFTPLHKN